MIRDWGEHVYQSDMTEELYEITTASFELVDTLLEIDLSSLQFRASPEAYVAALDSLQPHLDKLIELIGPTIEKYRKAVAEDSND